MSVPPTPTPARVRTSAPIRAAGGRRLPAAAVAALLVVALGVGALVGRSVAPSPAADAAAVVDRDIVPLSVDADGLWTAGSGELPPIGEQLATLRREDDAAAVAEHLQGWREAHDVLVRRMVGVDVPAVARPVQRQFVAAVALSRDALDLLEAAVDAPDAPARRELSSEALRLRTRSEQLTQAARAGLADLQGGGSGVAEPATLPSLTELR